MRKFKLMPFALLASVFGLSACTLPSWLSWLPWADKEEKEEEEEEKKKDETKSISFSGWVEGYAAQGITVVIPDYVGNKNIVLDETYKASGVLFVKNSNEKEMKSFNSKLEAAGWALEEKEYTDSPGDYYYTGGFAETRAGITVSDWNDTQYAGIYISFGLLPDENFPSADILADITQVMLAPSTDALPAPTLEASGGYGYTAARHELVMLCEEGSEAELVESYQNDLVTKGHYVYDHDDKYGDKHYVSPSGLLDVCVWNGADIEDDGYVYVEIDYAEFDEFPSARIAQDLSRYSITATLPVYSGTASSFYYSPERHKLVIYVEEGTEADADTRFESDLVGAGFTEGIIDQFGDQHYVSPNGQLDAVCWPATDIEETGYIVIDLGSPSSAE